jgi:nucleotide-binding universal stress UspA family protein
MFDTIVIPYDGSEKSALAFPYAELLPSRAVRLVRVEPNFQVLAPGPLANFRPDWRAIRAEQIEQELAPFAERFRGAGREVDVRPRFGEPAAEILDAASDADLIVMSTRGAGTIGGSLLGSVADRVARQSRMPVLLMPLPSGQGESDAISRVVVPLDGSALAEQALPIAASLAGILDVPVRLLHVIDPGAPESTGQGEAQQALDAHVQTLRDDGLDAAAAMLAGTPAPALIGALTPTDLVVMTSRGRGGLSRWLLGSVADRIVREAPAPVLLAPS